MSPIAAGDLVVSPNRARYGRVAHRVVEVRAAADLYRYRLACGYALGEALPAGPSSTAPPCRRCLDKSRGLGPLPPAGGPRQ